MIKKKKQNETKMKLNKELKALTLTELLVVMVIIGVLVLLALPKLMPQVTKAKTQEAKLQLKHLYTLEKTYFMEFSNYTTELPKIGYEAEKLRSEGGTANYRIEIIDASQTGFTAKATSEVDFDADGTFNVWQINEEKQLEEIVPD